MRKSPSSLSFSPPQPFLVLCGAGILLPLLAPGAQAWEAKKASLMTQWAADVSPTNALPDYPRPQLVRPDWLNLNGLWEYQPGAETDAAPVGKKLASEILVPYPVESALSGVMEHHDRLWYRRSFTVPPKWKGKHVRLNFGAVDYESEVFINGKSVGKHVGGYLPFSYDVTSYLQGDGPQELLVRVFDPTDDQGIPRGKQSTNPGGIMYTPTTGIWQTVWLEPVAADSVKDVHMVPDVDAGTVKFTVAATAAAAGTTAVIKIKDGGKVIQTVTAKPGAEVSIPIANAKLWSPDSPFLYDAEVTLMDGKTASDTVATYFGMRKISMGEVNGVQKMLLNNKPVFEMGTLDQGFWPDGCYTAPTDAALRSDIEMEKKFGFNMVRKHIKVEPARWYYWADKLGILVWQDMPSANSYNGRNTIKPEVDAPAYKEQLQGMVETLRDVPSIVSWVVFNESQGMHDVPELVSMVKGLDPTRLVNRNSGGGNAPQNGDVGDVDDVHDYPPPSAPGRSATQVLVNGEYGGIGYALPGHQWSEKYGGYTKVFSPSDGENTYGDFTNRLKVLQETRGLSAAVYTQISDVENELNGLMSYDRIPKFDAAVIAKANHFEAPQATYTAILPTSEQAPQTWKYTFTQTAPRRWNQPDFPAANWQEGPGAFGSTAPGNPKAGTAWTTPDIWMRSTFTLPQMTPQEVGRLMIKAYHNENVEVFINGVMAYNGRGYTTSYEISPVRQGAQDKLVLGGVNTIAVHCNQGQDGQFVDVGIYRRDVGK